MLKRLPKPRRTREPRRGSVLIFVVALLVLLALIGTAWISTTRTDRYTTQQNAVNTSVDLLVKGAADMAIGTIINDMFGSDGTFKGGANWANIDTSSRPAAVANVTNSAFAIDKFLASRVPEDYNGTAATRTGWPAITPPLYGGTFESPWVPNTADALRWNVTTNVLVDYTRPRATGSTNTLPGTSTALGGQVRPAFTINPTLASGRLVAAADADGDGLADAGLFRLPVQNLPVGQIEGFASSQITWYGAVRAIDNAAAINPITAWSRFSDYSGTSAAPAYEAQNGFFASAVGLRESLTDYDPTTATTYAPVGAQLTAWNPLRFNNVDRPFAASGNALIYLEDTTAANFQIRTTHPTQTNQGLNYTTFGESVHTNLARRFASPGPQTLSGQRFIKDIPLLSESLNLANRFVVKDTRLPSRIEGTAASPMLYNSLVSANNQAAYAVTNVTNAGTWFAENFAFAATAVGNAGLPGANGLMRSILTPSSPVGTTVPTSIIPQPASGALAVPANKISPNNASWVDMFGAFAAVMSTGVDATPFGAAAAAPNDPSVTAALPFGLYTGNKWGDYVGTQSENPAATGTQLPAVFDLTAVPFTTPATAPGRATPHPQRMFRSSIRDAGATAQTYVSPPGMVLIRAAIAAANAEALRYADKRTNTLPNFNGGMGLYNVREFPIALNQAGNATATANAQVRVYGYKPQPFITEVYVNNDAFSTFPGAPGPNADPYVAIELYNPYWFDIPLSYWHIGAIDRSSPTGRPGLATFLVAAINGTGFRFPLYDNSGAGNQKPVIPAGGYLVLENYDPAGTSPGVVARPPGLGTGLPVVGASTGVFTYFVPGLQDVVRPPAGAAAGSPAGREMVLLRPANLTGATVGGVADGSTITNPAHIDLVPVDSFDFTGFPGVGNASGGAGAATQWHYNRLTDTTTPKDWHFVYPGRYDASLTTTTANPQNVRRHQGTQALSYDPSATGSDVWNVAATRNGGTPVNLGGADTIASYPVTFPVQLFGRNWPGPLTNNATALSFPYGGFARDLDLLQIPFIGTYRIYTPGTAPTSYTLWELNSISADASMAEDTFRGTDVVEQIGRFCPLAIANWVSAGTANSVTDGQMVSFTTDTQAFRGMALAYSVGAGAPATPTGYTITAFAPTGGTFTVQSGALGAPGTTTGYTVWSPQYDFGHKLLDYFTAINNPQSDVQPGIPDATNTAYWNTVASFNAYAVPNVRGLTPATVNTAAERTAVNQGQININTASARVLAALPFYPGTPLQIAASQGIYSRNAGITIAEYRNRFGPFRSVMELNKVPGFMWARPAIGLTAALPPAPQQVNEPTVAFGDISPFAPMPAADTARDNVVNDFEKFFMIATRVSNVVTTRSDGYTVYVLVQGWVNVGTTSARPVIERRAAFLVDRSNITATNRRPTVYQIPVTGN
jgi:hypothetical protein